MNSCCSCGVCCDISIWIIGLNQKTSIKGMAGCFTATIIPQNCRVVNPKSRREMVTSFSCEKRGWCLENFKSRYSKQLPTNSSFSVNVGPLITNIWTSTFPKLLCIDILQFEMSYWICMSAHINFHVCLFFFITQLMDTSPPVVSPSSSGTGTIKDEPTASPGSSTSTGEESPGKREPDTDAIKMFVGQVSDEDCR